MHPAEQESPGRAKPAPQIGVFAARFRNRRAQFGIAQRAEQRKQPARNPRRENNRRPICPRRPFRSASEKFRCRSSCRRRSQRRPSARAPRTSPSGCGRLFGCGSIEFSGHFSSVPSDRVLRRDAPRRLCRKRAGDRADGESHDRSHQNVPGEGQRRQKCHGDHGGDARGKSRRARRFRWRAGSRCPAEKRRAGRHR